MEQSERIILALDVAETTGWCLKTETTLAYGHKSFTKPMKAAPTKGRLASHPGDRFWQMHIWLRAMIKEYKPTEISYEVPGGGTGRFSMMLLMGFRGVVYGVCGYYDLPIHETYPSSLKKWATGSGKATKLQMRKAWYASVKNKDFASATVVNPTDDEVDAIWLAEWAWKEVPCP